MKWIKRTTIALLIIFISSKLLFAPSLSNYVSEQKQANKHAQIRLYELINEEEFSPQRLRELLVLLDVPDPDMIFKQAKLETGWFTSRVFKEGRNLFGMHLSRVRETTASGYIIADNNRKVSKYDTWVDSVLDFVLYLEYYESLGYDIHNYDEFLTLSGYCESEGYVNLLKSMT